MAIQMWTPFRADQNLMQGYDRLGSGIGRGLANVGEAFTKAMEEKKRQGQLATSLRKTLKVAYPDRASEFDTMGLPDLQGTLEGEAINSAQAKRQEEMQAAQFERQMAQRKLAQDQALTQLWQDFGTRGQAPESVPGPVSNEEFDRRTSPVSPEAFMQAVGRSNVALRPDDMAAFMTSLERMQPKQVPDLKGILEGLKPKSVSVDSNGRPTMQFGPPEESKVPTGDYPWLFTDDLEAWKKGLREIKDPKEQARVIEARNAYETAQGRPSMMERLLMGTMKPGAGGAGGGNAAAPAPAAAQFSKGDQVRQDGVVYEFDGSKWIPK